MTTREHVIDLVNHLEPDDLAAVAPILERLVGRAPADLDVLQARWDAMPPDEEPLSEDEERAVADWRSRKVRGEKGIPHEEIRGRPRSAG